jgi:hypothetical protein
MIYNSKLKLKIIHENRIGHTPSGVEVEFQHVVQNFFRNEDDPLLDSKI